MCSRNSPYSLSCHVGAMLVFRMLCRITQSSDAHRTESVSVMDHEQTMGVSSRVLDQKQCISDILFNGLCKLTLSTPAVPNCCRSKGSVPYWSNPDFSAGALPIGLKFCVAVWPHLREVFSYFWDSHRAEF